MQILLFSREDCLLDYIEDDGDSVEPRFYDWGKDNWYNEAGEPLIANFKIYDKALTFSQNFEYFEV